MAKMDYVVLTSDPLDVNAIYKSVGDPSCGAVALFVGITRDNFEGKPVAQLEYEAYEPMAIKTLKNLAKELRDKFGVVNVAFQHRLGVVPVTEASVVIAVSSAHRKASLEAVSYAIDALKSSVPIFKKEFYEDASESQWKNNPESKGEMECISRMISQSDPVSNDLVQITANAEEIKRRIQSFMKRKREESNRNNLQDFCFHGAPIVEKENSCARVDAVLIRHKDSRSHLKVCRVENIVGPQLKGSHEKSNVTEPLAAESSCPPGAEERLANAERFLGLQSTALDVFARLKAVEDRILFLESISPEYFQDSILRDSESRENFGENFEIRKSSTEALKQRVAQLEMKLQGEANLFDNTLEWPSNL